MIIKNYGLFWRTDEVDWYPGRGANFQLIGRIGVNRPTIRLADFRHQQGIYILYGNHGPYYVGLTKKQGLGKRLKDHLDDKHFDKWDRFSWFGFQHVVPPANNGMSLLADMIDAEKIATNSVITDVEALLIRAMGLRNINQMNFSNADEWVQVKLDELIKYKNKISP